MRWLWIALLAACDKLPDPPSASEFAAMTHQQKCEATAPRATRCTDELMVGELRELTGDREAAEEIGRDYAAGPSPNARQAREIHDISCASDRDGSYLKAIVECWNVSDCTAFADCVYKARAPVGR